MSPTLLQLLVNNQVQLAYLRCSVPPDLVLQINNFFRLVLLFSVIRKGRREEMITKTSKYKLEDIQKFL